MNNLKRFSNKKLKILFLFCCMGLLSFVFVVRVYATKNYLEPDAPRFSGSYSLKPVQATNEISVVSYNIRYALNMTEAIAELKALDTQEGIDILLLQEMDEVGTEQLAEALALNYVYYPAGIEPLYSHNFGPAILSKWPISDAQKIILPHKSLSTGMNRVATRATVTVQDVDILVYSIHAETIMTLPSFRQDQFEAVLANVGPDAAYVIVGGDFNTVTNADVEKLTSFHQDAGFVRATTDTGYTLLRYQVEAVADHVFSKGFTVVASGKMANATASDHLPIWTKLVLVE